MSRAGRWGTTALAAVLAAALLAVLLWPEGWSLNRAVVAVYVFFLNLGVPAWVTPEAYAVVLNVLAFVPLGWLGVALLRRRPLAVVVVLAILSVAVELVQTLPGLSRDPSAVDVVLNTTGAVLGAGLGRLTRRRAGNAGTSVR